MTASSFGFAVMAALVRLLSAQLGQYWLVLLRAGITALVFLAVLLVLRRPLLPRKGMGLLVFRGLAGFGGIACLFYGAIHLPLAVATLLNWCSLLFVIVFSGVFLKERIPSGTAGWIGLSVLGLLLLVLPGMARDAQLGVHLPPFAVAIGLLGAIFSAMAMTAVRAAALRFPPELIIFHFSAIAAGIALPLALAEGSPAHAAGLIFSSPVRVAEVVLLGLSGSAAQYAMTRGYAVASAGLASALSLLTAAFSAILGWWFFDERLSAWQWLGVLGLAAGVLGSSHSSGPRRAGITGSGLARTPEIG